MVLDRSPEFLALEFLMINWMESFEQLCPIVQFINADLTVKPQLYSLPTIVSSADNLCKQFRPRLGPMIWI